MDEKCLNDYVQRDEGNKRRAVCILSAEITSLLLLSSALG